MHSLSAREKRAAKKPPENPVACGTSNGNRTHDFALRGQRLNRLTMEAMAGELGFEPRQYESESQVLPLHHSPMCLSCSAESIIHGYAADVNPKFSFFSFFFNSPADQIRMNACPPPQREKARKSVSSTHSALARQMANSAMQVRITRRIPRALQSRNG